MVDVSAMAKVFCLEPIIRSTTKVFCDAKTPGIQLLRFSEAFLSYFAMVQKQLSLEPEGAELRLRLRYFYFYSGRKARS